MRKKTPVQRAESELQHRVEGGDRGRHIRRAVERLQKRRDAKTRLDKMLADGEEALSQLNKPVL